MSKLITSEQINTQAGEQFIVSEFNSFAALPYGFWLDPFGRFWKVIDSAGHLEAIFKLTGIYFYSDAYDYGFVRIASDYGIAIQLEHTRIYDDPILFSRPATDSLISYIRRYLEILPNAEKYSNKFRRLYSENSQPAYHVRVILSGENKFFDLKQEDSFDLLVNYLNEWTEGTSSPAVRSTTINTPKLTTI